jgi:hypothetical protein
MSKFRDDYDEAVERADWGIELERLDETEGDGVAAVIAASDTEGRSLIIQVGTGDEGPFANVTGYLNDEPGEVKVFSTDHAAMLIVDQ